MVAASTIINGCEVDAVQIAELSYEHAQGVVAQAALERDCSPSHIENEWLRVEPDISAAILARRWPKAE
jgi:hypothetical protein